MMNIPAAHWPRLFKLLDTALELDESARATWIDKLDGEEAALKPSLLELLAQHARIETADFLVQPAPATAAFMASGIAEFQDSLRPNALVGGYTLLREIGRGGMGTVWLAERADHIKRQVALKLPYAGPLQAQLAARFTRERDILAALTHPHIARLYDAGASESGQPFLAMEYVEGKPINEYCDEHQLNIRKRIELFRQVLRAVQYAHTNLVVHRDLKPNNILVTSDGQAKLLDFGIAKLVSEGEINATALTQFGGRALTPDYASPEQIAGGTIGTGSDVYSLGVMFFELLTGQRPYRLKRDSRGALEDAILNTPTPWPSHTVMSDEAAAARGHSSEKIRKQLAGDLDVVALKALKKSPLERYATVDAFAQDIERYLKDQPVLAQADSAWYRAKKFVSRNRLAVSGVFIVVTALVAGISVAVWQAALAREQAAHAQQAKQFVLSIFENADPDAGGGEKTTALDLLHQAQARVDEEFKNQFETRLELQTSLAYSLVGLGQEASAVESLEPLVNEAASRLGEDNELTVAARGVLAEGYFGVGRNADAVREFKLVLSRAEAQGYFKHAINAAHWLGARSLDAGQIEEGVAFAQRSVDLADLHAKEISIQLRASAYAGLARVLSATRRPGQLAAAQRAYELSKEANQGRVTPGLLNTQLALALAYRGEGQYAQAIKECEAVLPQLERILGPQHIYVSVAKSYLAQSQFARGQLTAALDNARGSLAIVDRIDGDQPTMSRVIGRVNVAATLGSMRRGSEAIATGRDALDLLSRGVGLQHPRALSLRADLSYALILQGKWDEAESTLESILLAKPKDAGVVLRAQVYLALVRSHQARHDEAIALAKNALTTSASITDPYARYRALKVAGVVFNDANQSSAAIAPLLEALAIINNAHPFGSPDVADIELYLGNAYLKTSELEKARAHLRAADEFWQKFDPSNRQAGLAAAAYAHGLLATPSASDWASTTKRAIAILRQAGMLQADQPAIAALEAGLRSK